MKGLYQILDIHFKKVTKGDYDCVLLVTGDEGKGKSNLVLHILEWWYTKLYGECTPEQVKHINLDMEEYVKDLRDCKRFEATVYDEAGDISNKRTMSKTNVALSQAYQVIRGDNLMTILVLPSLFDIDGFFSKRRARGLIHVTKRGDLRYYSQNRLRKIIALNQSRIIKTLNVTLPTIYDHFPKYTGCLHEPYLEKKREKMKTIREKLYDNFKETTEFDPLKKRNEMIAKIKDKLGGTKTAELLGMSRTQVNTISKEEKENCSLVG